MRSITCSTYKENIFRVHFDSWNQIAEIKLGEGKGISLWIHLGWKFHWSGSVFRLFISEYLLNEMNI